MLQDVLRDEWGFDGYVISDEGAIEDILYNHKYTKSIPETAAAAVNAGACVDKMTSYDVISTVFDHAQYVLRTVLSTKRLPQQHCK